MMGAGVIAAAVAPHTPRIGVEEDAPEFQRGLIQGLRELGEELRGRGPELFVLLSSHWITTFNWYVTSQPRHEGLCLADEAPDLVPGLSYASPGDPAFAQELQSHAEGAGVPLSLNDSPHFTWDYGSFVPLKYLDPHGEVPTVLLPSVICADLDECFTIVRLVHETALAMDKRVVFIASCALSHQVRRGPELWPTEPLQDLDRRFIDLVTRADVSGLLEFTPAYYRDAYAEMNGRPLSGMMGALQAMAGSTDSLNGKMFGEFAQSSGSGNAALGIFAGA